MHPLATARHLRLDINHCKRSFEVVTCHGAQVCSQPYSFELEIICHREVLNPDDLLFATAYLHSREVATGIHGHIQSIACVTNAPAPTREALVRSSQPTAARYRITLGPRLGLMAYRHNRRIFQDMSAERIITQVLSEHGIEDDAYLWQAKRSCVERDYCAQYYESDMQCVQRLCEEEGLHYFFIHSRHRHVVVFADQGSAAPPSLYLGEQQTLDAAPAATRHPAHPLRASVVGELFEPAQIDAKGRLNVRFDWSHQGDGARFNECWLPIDSAMNQPDAHWWGGLEVVVSFQNDHPDSPYISERLWDPCINSHRLPQTINSRPEVITTRIDSGLFLDDSRQFSTEEGVLIEVSKNSQLRFSVGSSDVLIDGGEMSLSGLSVVMAALQPDGDKGEQAPQV